MLVFSGAGPKTLIILKHPCNLEAEKTGENNYKASLLGKSVLSVLSCQSWVDEEWELSGGKAGLKPNTYLR